MNASKEISIVRRKVFLAYHQDGILDIMVAVVVLGFGTFMATGSAIFLVLGAVLATQYVLLKQSVTIPRFGYVRFDTEKETRKQGWLLVSLGVLFLLLIIFLTSLRGRGSASPEMQAWIQKYHMLPISGMLFGLPALVVALFLGLKRFYLYALLTVGLPFLGAWLDVETYIPIIAIGVVVLGFGITLLSNFIRTHPVEDREGNHGSGK